MINLNEITEWFKKHGSIEELNILGPLDSEDFLTYQSFEYSKSDSINALNSSIENELELTPNYFIREKEYDYDSKDKCGNCGYFEPNDYSINRYGYCTKFGEDTNPKTTSCDVRIII
jgi:hypothetical protein